MAGVILHPLAEVGIGMFVAVVIGGGQFVMDLQRGGKRRHREQHAGEEQRDDRAGFSLGEMTKHDRSGRQIREP